MNCDKALDLLNIHTINSYRARKAETIRLCREWGVMPVEVVIQTRGITKVRYDFNRTLAKLARHVLLHSELSQDAN